MAKSVLPLVPSLRNRLDESLDLTARAEHVFNEFRRRRISARLTTRHIEQIYELAYLKAFIEWEAFLEESFLKYVAGYANSIGREPILTTYARSYDRAFTLVASGNDFLLWHNPTKVIQRARRFFLLGLHETVLASNAPRLEGFSNIRHRIVHNHADSRLKFANASINIAARRYHGGRPGTMLRDFEPTGAIRRRWIEVILNELWLTAQQIVP